MVWCVSECVCVCVCMCVDLAAAAAAAPPLLASVYRVQTFQHMSVFSRITHELLKNYSRVERTRLLSGRGQEIKINCVTQVEEIRVKPSDYWRNGVS